MNSRPLMVILSFCALVMLALALSLLRAHNEWHPPEPLVPEFETVEVAAEASNANGADAFQAMLERPLFFASRRPPPPAPVAVEAESTRDPFEGVALQGIYSAGTTLAGVTVNENGVSKRLALGEKLGEWSLVSVSGLEVKFERSGQEKVLALKHAAQVAAASPPPVKGASVPPAAGQSAPFAPPTQDVVATPNQNGAISAGLNKAIEERERRRQENRAAFKAQLDAKRKALEAAQANAGK